MSPELSRNDIAWPVVTIDFEASGLGRLTYPIEIALCEWKGPGSPARTWHSLIAITDDWSRRGVWNETSQIIHGISRDALTNAPCARHVMRAANRFAPLGTLAFCDGGGHDSYWLERLAHAAEIAPRFMLGSMSTIVGAMSTSQREAFLRQREERQTAHRAAPDAEDHVSGLAIALGVERPLFERVGSV